MPSKYIDHCKGEKPHVDYHFTSKLDIASVTYVIAIGQHKLDLKLSVSGQIFVGNHSHLQFWLGVL